MVKRPTYSELQQKVKELKSALQRRKQAQAAFRESEELHRIILESMSDAVLLTDDYGKFVFICGNVNIIFGYSSKEVNGLKNVNELLLSSEKGRHRVDRIFESK